MKVHKKEINDYFDLDKILYGQCFRWKKQEDGKYIGVIDNNVIKIWQEDNTIYYYGYNDKDIDDIIYNYFDLGTNYKKIILGIKNKCNNKFLDKIIEYSKGTRILNQSMFEIVISYIFSSSNNIPRIEGSIEKLSSLYGKKVIFEDKEYYLFPKVNDLDGVTEEKYKEEIRIGYRAPYVAKTVEKILSGKYDLDKISKMNTENAKKILLELDGVGPKVADCILLFSMKKKDVFPVDTWINKVMKIYSKNENINKKEITNLINEDFGKYSGIINHYMFYWGRENKI